MRERGGEDGGDGDTNKNDKNEDRVSPRNAECVDDARVPVADDETRAEEMASASALDAALAAAALAAADLASAREASARASRAVDAARVEKDAADCALADAARRRDAECADARTPASSRLGKPQPFVAGGDFRAGGGGDRRRVLR